MKKTTRLAWPTLAALGAALVLAMTSAAAEAQAPAQTKPAAQAKPTAAKANPADVRRAEIKRKLMAFRAYRLTEELSLDEVTAAKVFPLLAKYDQQVEQLTAERMTLHKELRQGPTDARALDDLIRRTLANRRAIVDLEERRIRDVRGVLTPAQTARLLVVLPEIERQIKNQIRRSMRREESGEDGETLNPFSNRKRDRKRMRDPFRE